MIKSWLEDLRTSALAGALRTVSEGLTSMRTRAV